MRLQGHKQGLFTVTHTLNEKSDLNLVPVFELYTLIQGTFLSLKLPLPAVLALSLSICLLVKITQKIVSY